MSPINCYQAPARRADLTDRMLLIMFLMYTTAHHSIRKQCFEAFWYTHHLVRAPSFLAICLHVPWIRQTHLTS